MSNSELAKRQRVQVVWVGVLLIANWFASFQLGFLTMRSEILTKTTKKLLFSRNYEFCFFFIFNISYEKSLLFNWREKIELTWNVFSNSLCLNVNSIVNQVFSSCQERRLRRSAKHLTSRIILLQKRRNRSVNMIVKSKSSFIHGSWKVSKSSFCSSKF